MLEKQFWNLLKKHLLGDVSRIENCVDSGTPDVTGAWLNPATNSCIDYWIELKVCNNKNKLRDPVKLCSDSQLIWHLKRGKQGSLIYVMVKYSHCIMVYKWQSRYATYRPLLRLDKIRNKFNWQEFEKLFKNRLNSEIDRRKL